MTRPLFEYRFSVPLHDVDGAGVMFFAHLFRHAHDAYEAFMAERGIPLAALLADGDMHLPLAHAEADYLHPIRHGDKVRVILEVENLGHRAFTLGYRFLDENGEVLAVAKTVHVHLAVAQGAPTALPPRLRQILQASDTA